MSTRLYDSTHGTLGFQLAYTLMLGAMLVPLIRARAAAVRYLLAVALAFVMLVVAALTIGLTSGVLRIFGIGGAGVLQLLYGVIVVALIGYAAGRALAEHGAEPGPQHRRGAVVRVRDAPLGRRGAPAPTLRDAGTQGDPDTLTIAGVPIPPADETKHFKIIGTTGTGKSTAIHEVLIGALGRGDRAVIADPDGGYLRRFYDAARGDVILNPWEEDAHKWDLFGEITEDYDIEHVVRSLIPDGGDSERAWCEYARTFLTEVIRQLREVKVQSDIELCRLVKSATEEELREMLAGTPAGPFLARDNERMFGSLRSVASSAIGALQYITAQKAQPFSVRRWVREGAARQAGGWGGVLFLPYKAGEIAALRSVVSAWMRLGIFEAMDREESDQRIWFVVDELDALAAIDGLKDALARLRKFGGRCILGFQSIAQVSGTYGRGGAETIVENCGNTLILRCSASEYGGTSEFASKLIGQRDLVHRIRSWSRRAGDWRATRTTSELLRTDPAVLASEIERLPDLEGFLKLASIPDWQPVRLAPLPRVTVIRRQAGASVATASPGAQTAPAAAQLAPAEAQPAPAAGPLASAAAPAAVRKRPGAGQSSS